MATREPQRPPRTRGKLLATRSMPAGSLYSRRLESSNTVGDHLEGRQDDSAPQQIGRAPIRATKSFHLPRPQMSNIPERLQMMMGHRSIPFSTFNISYSSVHVEQHDPQFDKDLEALSYTNQDVESIVMEDEAFHNLKQCLRKRGCVTNAYLKENVHFYVQHVKQVGEIRGQGKVFLEELGVSPILQHS